MFLKIFLLFRSWLTRAGPMHWGCHHCKEYDCSFGGGEVFFLAIISYDTPRRLETQGDTKQPVTDPLVESINRVSEYRTN